ncbi:MULTISPECIES: tetratricopeptide repeat protein [unclassified Lentimicrobium]|uniref:tetratricopeptide repeat protein n=1 Tax=unclassified Lentimicrobium TaxID=2677434 RepID=UPI0020A67126|nr:MULTISPECIES: tetratricopeptide repeat protein [unclassified Lentimicrobium]
MNNTNRNIVLFFILLGFIIPMTSLAQSDKKLVRQGNKEFQNGNFNEAEINYRKALDKNPQKQSAQFNLGDALYEQENYEKAAEVFANSSVEKISNFEKSNTAYNLGNSFLKGGKLNESIAAYKQALKFNPENEEARYNLEYARQKQAQQEQQNQDQNKDDKQDQDKDKQDQNQDQQEQNKDQQEQNQDQQQQDQQNQDQQQQDQQNQQGNQNEQQAQKISKKDAERMLEALKNNEKKTLEKLKKEKKKNAKVIKSEKDW